MQRVLGTRMGIGATPTYHTMKLKLEIELDVGDHFNGFSQEEIENQIDYGYITHITNTHLRDHLTWVLKYGEGPVSQRHLAWAKLSVPTSWKVKIIEK